MELTDTTFTAMIEALEKTYLNWELPDESLIAWKNVLASSISEELLPRVIADWMLNKTAAPKNPAEIIQYGREMFSAGLDSADISAELIIDSARNAYYVTDDFLTFADGYENSFAAALGTPAQEAYIVDNIRKRSNNPKILILVYDELKGELKDCFTGDAEHGVDFLRTHIKKTWNAKSNDAAKHFMISGNTEFKRLTVGDRGMLDG